MIAEEVRLTLTVVGGPPRAGETFELALTVFNDGELDAVIDFPNGQRYDFEIFATDGTRVWQWAEGMMFTMMIGRETIRGGETLRWTERIPTGLEAGTYRVVGTLAAMERQAVEMTLQVTAP